MIQKQIPIQSAVALVSSTAVLATANKINIKKTRPIREASIFELILLGTALIYFILETS